MGVNEGKSVVQWEGKVVKENTEKGLRRGIKALKEIKKYQTSTDLLIRRPKVSEQIYGSKVQLSWRQERPF